VPAPPSSGPAPPPATTHLLDFLDVAVIVAGRAGLAGLDAFVVLEQRGDLRAQGGRQRPPRRVPGAEGEPRCHAAPGNAARVPVESQLRGHIVRILSRREMGG